MDYFKNTKGAISVFLVIILVPMMMVSAFFVDASKVKLANGVAESAGDLALNTALTDYDTKLKDLYGLFATAQDTEELYEKLESYYKSCITSSGVADEDADNFVDMIMAQLQMTENDGKTSDVLNMQLMDFDVSKIPEASLGKNASVVERQIVDFMKYRAPINTGLSFISSLQSFATLSEQTDLVDKRQEYYEEQESVMKNAEEAWNHIYQYNKEGYAKSDDYFPTMKEKFDNYQIKLDAITKKVIMDLYDAQNYVGFNPKIYSIIGVEVEVNGKKKTVPYFYLDKEKTSKLTPYNELTTYSNSKKATADNIRTALNEYYTAFNAVKTAQQELMEYDENTYGQQYLVQTNRRKLYETWVLSVKKLYEKYSMLRHAVTYNGTTSDGKSVMTTSEKLFGQSSEHTFKQYYDWCTGGVDDFTEGDRNSYDFYTVAVVFNQYLSEFNTILQKYRDDANADITETNNKIYDIYREVTEYRRAVAEGKEQADAAIIYLGYVYDQVKSGGSLEQKKDSWEGAASSGKLKNTSMARQDLAEIDSLSTYLKPEDVDKLKSRLQNISDELEKLLDEIDSYTYFGTMLSEIDGYQTFINILENKIGANQLKMVPTNKQELEQKISLWCENQYVIGKKIDVSWRTQSGKQPRLAGENVDKLNFYTYLYQHFNRETASSSKEKAKESKESAESLYNDTKSKSSEEASKDADSSSGGKLQPEKELQNIENRPSKNIGNDSCVQGFEKAETGDNAVKSTGAGLGKMLSNLAEQAMNMGANLRDKLYVSDYILSMFSYDTIEAEYKLKHPGEDKIKLETLTYNPIDKDHNIAYGAEVEYIIWGGENSSNITKTYASIYGIRFAFNLIYAFTDSSIRDAAFAIATPISAATLGVIPVPLIQAVIIIGIGAIESGLDLVKLKDGESVPLFKDSETWVCSVKGLFNTVKKEVGEQLTSFVSDGIDLATEKLNEYLDMTDEQLSKAIDGKTDDLVGLVSDSYDEMITRHVNTSIQKLTTSCNNAIEEHMLDPTIDMSDYVKKKMDSWIAEEASTSGEDDIAYTIKKEAVGIIKEQFVDSIVSGIKSNAENVEQSIADSANRVNELVGSVRDKITSQILKGSDKIKEYKDKLKDDFKESIKKGSANLKETLTEKMDGVFGSGSGSKEAKDSTGLASLLNFSYKDYLRLFLMIGLCTGGEEGVILRTSDVIQANMGKITNNNNYALENAAAYVRIKATIQVKPTMLALPLFANVENNPYTNTGWYTIEYKSVRGY